MSDHQYAKENEHEFNYLFVHILPLKTGEHYIREIIKADCIKKFKSTKYRADKDYKRKKFNLVFGPEGNKYKCYILYAGDTYDEVQRASTKKRFTVPTHGETLTDSQIEEIAKDNDNISTTVENEGDENVVDVLQNAKKKEKKITKQKKTNKNQAEDAILQKYMENSGAAEEDGDVFDDDRPPNTIHSSTPLKYRDIENDKDAVIRAQAIQIKHLNFQLKESRHEVKKMKIDLEKQFNELSSLPLQERTNENNEAQMTSMKHPTSIDPFRVHDRIYGFNVEQRCEEEIFDEKGNIHIGFGVYCNLTAYYDSFKGKNPYKCLYLLSQGVYDLKDLSERCVRRQSNTANKKVLSPKKNNGNRKKSLCFFAN